MFKKTDIAKDFFLASQERTNEVACAVLKESTGQVRASRVRDDGSVATTLGSCFLFSNKYFVLTCSHVVHDAAEIWVGFDSGVNLRACLVAENTDENTDLALLQLVGFEGQTHSARYLRLTSVPPPQGSISFCAGFDENGFQFTTGLFQNSGAAMKLVVTNQTDHGTSGGPCCGAGMFNLIGVIKEDYGVAHHRTTLVPYFTVYSFIEGCARSFGTPMIEEFQMSQDYFT